MWFDDLTGRRFGKLVVTPTFQTKGGHAYWLCRCDCGGEKMVRGSHLKDGHVTSCGCKPRHVTHGGSGTRLYITWRNMISRCTNPKDPQFFRYGSRGIAVCDAWRDSFQAFHDLAMANGYREDLTIDRINNDGNYCPDNCRWATRLEQAQNTRKTRLITYNGETHSVCEWARILGMNQGTLNNRLNLYGWSVEDALGKEVKKCH